VLEQVDPKVLRLTGEDPPHRPGLGSRQAREDRVRERRVRRVAGRHRRAVVLVERNVEALDQGCRLAGHGLIPTTDAPPTGRGTMPPCSPSRSWWSRSDSRTRSTRRPWPPPSSSPPSGTPPRG